jgi:hypothetical protein
MTVASATPPAKITARKHQLQQRQTNSIRSEMDFCLPGRCILSICSYGSPFLAAEGSSRVMISIHQPAIWTDRKCANPARHPPAQTSNSAAPAHRK